MTVENDQYSLATTREIPDVDSIIEMAGIMMMEGGNNTREDVESLTQRLAMESGDSFRLCFE